MASITIDEAARYLDVSTRTISTYISQGIVTYHKKKGSNRKYIEVKDLHDLKAAKDEGDFSVKSYRKLQAKVSRLEAQLNVVLKILDTNQISLGVSAEEAIELVSAATTTLDSVLSVEHTEAWLPILLALDEHDLESIQAASKIDKPWQPFLSLCISLIVYITGNKNYTTDLSMQMLHKELAEARRRLRLAALLYIEGKGPSVEVDNLVTTRPNTVVETLTQRLRKK